MKKPIIVGLNQSVREGIKHEIASSELNAATKEAVLNNIDCNYSPC